MKIKCPQCVASLRVSSPKLFGKQVNCPRCGASVPVPDSQLENDEVRTYKKVRCNGCLSKLRVKPELIGKSILCPLCNKRIRTPVPKPKIDSYVPPSNPEFIKAVAIESDSDPLLDSRLPPQSIEAQNSNSDDSDDVSHSSAVSFDLMDSDDASDEISEPKASFLRPTDSEPKTPGQVHSKAPKRKNWLLVPLMIAIAAAIAVVVVGTLAYLYFSRGGKLETTSDSKAQAVIFQTESNQNGGIHLASVAGIPGF